MELEIETGKMEDEDFELMTEYEVAIRYEEDTSGESFVSLVRQCLVSCDHPQGYCGSALQQWMPIIKWLPKYEIKKSFLLDIICGITVGVVLLPQGLSYGILAGLPAEYGLYSCLTAPVVYTLLGTCTQLQIGPFALISLLVNSMVGAIVDPDEDMERYTNTVLACTMMVGVLMACMSFCHMGFLVNYLSVPVMSGLTTAGALLIATSQMGNFLGVSVARSNFFKNWYDIFKNLGSANVATILIGCLCLGILLSFRFFKMRSEFGKTHKWVSTLPIALFVMLFAMLITWMGNLESKYNVQVLGDIPPGIPAPRIPESKYWTSQLLMPTLVISLVGYALSIATAKTFADKNKYEILPNQELFAIGMANLFSGMCNSYPSFSSLSRSALVHEIGAPSMLYNLVSAALVALVLLCLTKFLYYLPVSALSAIILDALFSLFLQMSEPLHLWKTSKRDFIVWTGTFFAVLGLGVATGLGIGLALSIAVLLQMVSYPHHAVLGRFPGISWLYKDSKRYRDVVDVPGVIIFRFDSSLHFANRDCFKESLMEGVSKRTSLHTLVLDAAAITSVDKSAMDYLRKINKILGVKGIEVIFANCRGCLRDALRTENISVQAYLCVHDAVKYAEHKKLHVK